MIRMITLDLVSFYFHTTGALYMKIIVLRPFIINIMIIIIKERKNNSSGSHDVYRVFSILYYEGGVVLPLT